MPKTLIESRIFVNSYKTVCTIKNKQQQMIIYFIYYLVQWIKRFDWCSENIDKEKLKLMNTWLKHSITFYQF